MSRKYYSYFVSFSHSKGFGSVNMLVENKIKTHDPIKQMAKKIEDENDVKGVIIINFQLFAKREKPLESEVVVGT